MKVKNVSLITMLFFVAFSFTACQEDESAKEVKALQEEFNSTMKETIAVHDEVMPKMGEINKLISQLEQQSEKMQPEEFRSATIQLQEAHDEMMSWMKSLSETFDKNEINQGITEEDKEMLKAKVGKLNVLKKAADTMRDNILSSTQNASELLSKYQ